MKYLLTIAFLCLISKIHGQSAANVCEGVANGVFVADIAACNQYFTCMNNVAHPNTCPDPFLFSEPQQTCNWASEVECFECVDNTFSRQPVTGSCTQFIQCSGGAPAILECPSGLNFNPTAEECDIAYECLANPCPPIDQPSNPIFVPHPTDCQLYFVCEAGEMLERPCPDGTHWNQNAGACDLPAAAQCPNAEEPPEPTTTVPPLVTCQPTGIQFLPHPTDCNRYFICSNGVANEQACAPTKHWDATNQRCDTVEAAGCTASF